MKKITNVLGIIAIVAVIGFSFTACDEGGGDDGITIDGWKYSVYTDKDNGGSSTITMTQGTGSNSNRITISGNVSFIDKTVEYPYGFAGLAIKPNAENLTALKQSDGFSLNMVGDGKKYMLEVRTSDITDYSYYSVIFDSPKTEESVEFLYENLVAASWGQGQETPFDKNKITHIEIQARAEDHITGEGTFNLIVWK